MKIIKLFPLVLLAISPYSFAVNESDSLSLTTNMYERYNINLSAGGGVSDMIQVAPIDYSYSEWEEYGEPYNCQYEPMANTIDKGVIFDQELYCVQKQTRYKYTLINGVVAKTESEYKEIDAEHTQEAVGTLTYTTVIEYSDWVNYGSVFNCGAYSPSESTVNQGVTFSQSRGCYQTQSIIKNTYKVNDVTGSRSLTSSATEFRNISVTQSRLATGTKVTGGTWIEISTSDVYAYDNRFKTFMSGLGDGATSGTINIKNQPCPTKGLKHYYKWDHRFNRAQFEWFYVGDILECR